MSSDQPTSTSERAAGSLDTDLVVEKGRKGCEEWIFKVVVAKISSARVCSVSEV